MPSRQQQLKIDDAYLLGIALGQIHEGRRSSVSAVEAWNRNQPNSFLDRLVKRRLVRVRSAEKGTFDAQLTKTGWKRLGDPESLEAVMRLNQSW